MYGASFSAAKQKTPFFCFLPKKFFQPIFQLGLFSLFMTFQELSVVVEETSTFVFATTAKKSIWS